MTVACLAVVTGYLSTLLTQTVTYSAREFHAGTATEGVALAIVRGDVIVAFGLLAVADRRGRRVVAIAGAAFGAAFTALGALSPSLPWLVASQVVARGFVTAATITAAVLLAESMPKGARAWAVGVIAIATAAGAGVCVLALPVAGMGTRGWRVLYAVAIVWLLAIIPIARKLPESPRFERLRRASRQRLTVSRRLKLLCGAAFLFQMFITPASQFQNEYLRRERGFSPGRISLFTVVTAVPAAIGIVLGGRLADTRGRRSIAIGAVGGVAIGATLSYLTGGWSMWILTIFAGVTGAAVVPALTVYGPELFATNHRGAANGVIAGAGRIGSVIGLLAVGAIADQTGHFGPGFAAVAIAPLGLVVLIFVAFPETARRSLEELNPEDAGGLS
ncbi:MAG: MFS transporter [Acidimicrobiales bacterium]